MPFDGDDLFVADVEKGGNYGWNVKEGIHCFTAEDCPDETPEDVRGGEPLLNPIIEYPHPGGEADLSGVSVIGGYVYRSSALSDLEGTYVFGTSMGTDGCSLSAPTATGCGRPASSRSRTARRSSNGSSRLAATTGSSPYSEAGTTAASLGSISQVLTPLTDTSRAVTGIVTLGSSAPARSQRTESPAP